MKKCFSCWRNLPLFFFQKNTSKYQRPINKGRCFNCRFCTFKQAIKTKSYVKKIDGKFKVIHETNLKRIFYDTFWKQ